MTDNELVHKAKDLISRLVYDREGVEAVATLLARWVAAERRAREAEAEARNLSGQYWAE